MNYRIINSHWLNSTIWCSNNSFKRSMLISWSMQGSWVSNNSSSSSSSNRIRKANSSSTNKQLINRSTPYNRSRSNRQWPKDERARGIGVSRSMLLISRHRTQAKIRNLVLSSTFRIHQVSSIILNRCHFRIILNLINLSILTKISK